MKKKIYVSILLSTYVLATAVILSVSVWIQGYDGDLTRVGHLLENNYGWNKPLKVFPKDHTIYRGHQEKNYTGKEDIVVFGDSFSHMPLISKSRNYGWPSFLYEKYGLTTFVYHLEQVSITKWLAKTDPKTLPDYIVYERVERRIKDYEAQRVPSETCSINTPRVAYRVPPLIPVPPTMKEISRDHGSLFELNTAIYWLNGLFEKHRAATAYPLTRNDLFSDRRNDHVLVISGLFDLDRIFTSDKIRNLSCYLWDLKKKIESNGRTKFIIAIIPDKYRVYSPYIKHLPQKTINVLDKMDEQGLHLYRFDKLFEQEVASGAVGPDVYLPNDTHWGPEGSRIFASAIYDLMKHSGGMPLPRRK